MLDDELLDRLHYHFLDLQSGTRVWQCEVSPIDTSFLVAGIMTAAAFFT